MNQAPKEKLNLYGYLKCRCLIYQTHLFLFVNNVGLMNQAPTDESSPYNYVLFAMFYAVPSIEKFETLSCLCYF